MQKNQNKETRRVYGIIIEGGNHVFLSLQFAEKLEEAFLMAKKEFGRQNPEYADAMMGAKISLFAIKTIEELHKPELSSFKIAQKKTKLGNNQPPIIDFLEVVNKLTDVLADPVTKTEVPTSKAVKPPSLDTSFLKKGAASGNKTLVKNRLMGQIIKNKDMNLFEKNKTFFSIPERKYIRNKLKELPETK